MRIASVLLAAIALPVIGCNDDDGAAPPTGTATANNWPMLAHDARSTFHNPNETTLTTENARSTYVAISPS